MKRWGNREVRKGRNVAEGGMKGRWGSREVRRVRNMRGEGR